MKLRHVIVFFLLALTSRESIAASDSISVTVDTLCDGWRVCVTDQRIDGSIASIKLKNSPRYVYFDSSIDNDKDGIVVFSPPQKSLCLDVYVDNYYVKAADTIVIVSNYDDSMSVYLDSDSLFVSFTPSKEFGYDFGRYPLNYRKSKRFSIDNLKHNKYSVRIDSIFMSSMNSTFKISNVDSKLPKTLLPNENLDYFLDVHVLDTGTVFDTINIISDCFVEKIPVQVSALIAIISTADQQFDSVYLGESVCKQVEIMNSGGLSFITIDAEIIGSPTISLKEIFPIHRELFLTGFAPFTVCYSPIYSNSFDTAFIIWSTGFSSDFMVQMKDTTVVIGHSLSTSLYWDREQHVFTGDSIDLGYTNVFFYTQVPAGVVVKRFYITGIDKNDFQIINSSASLTNYSLSRDESNWFTIAFKPDMTKPLPERYADRHATLVAELKDSNVTMELIGTFNPLHVKHELALEDFSFSPNPVYGQDATLSFTLAEPKQFSISIYDMLGREMMSIPSQYYSSGSYSNTIGTSKLGDGSYILRVSDGVLTKSISFRVMQ